MDLIRSATRIAWEPLMTIPTPWRAAMLLLAAQLIAYAFVTGFWRRTAMVGAHIVWFAGEVVGAALLLPEFLVTRRLRAAGHDPLPGTYAVGDGIQAFTRFLMSLDARASHLRDRPRTRNKKRMRAVVVVALVVASLPLVAWQARPHVERGGVLAGYIDEGIGKWCSLESWVFDHGSAGRWRCEHSFATGSETRWAAHRSRERR